MNRPPTVLLAVAFLAAVVSSCARERALQARHDAGAAPSFHAGEIEDVPAVGELARRCAAIIRGRRLVSIRFRGAEVDVENLQV